MDKIELKPCPFCGGEAKTVCLSVASDWAMYIAKIFEIKCSRCGCVAPRNYRVRVEIDNAGNASLSEPGKEEAIEAWNRRAGE